MIIENQQDMVKKPPNRFAILDPLRLIAALAVLFYHYLPFFRGSFIGEAFNFCKYGYLGVNFFFMLSGFVIISSSENRSAWKFAILRGLRLYPAFIVCLLITLLSLHFLGGVTPPFKNIVLNSLILNDYFKIPNIDGVYWTLQAELKFYGCVFFLILFGVISKPKIWMTIWILAAVSFHFTRQPFFLGWFISPGYSFFFIGGICAYKLIKERYDIFYNVVFLIACVFSLIKTGDQISGFIHEASYFDAVVAKLLIFFIYLFFWLLSRGWFNVDSSRSLIFMGAVSYPVYLIHSVAGKTLIDFMKLYIGTELSVFIAIFVVLVIASVVHLYFEQPIFKFVRAKLAIR